MELRRLAVCLVLFVAAISHCSEAHSMRRRQASNDDVNYDDNFLGDEAGDEDTQNDTDPDDQSERNETEVLATIVTPPKNYVVNSTNDVLLECVVSPPNTVVSWFKNNVQFFLGSINLQTEETRYSIAPGSKHLLIKNVQGSDSGIYRCEAMQRVPVAINHTLLVLEKPFVNISSSHGGVVGVGSDLTITCQTSGYPMPEVLWSRDRNNLNKRLTEKEGEYTFEGNTHSLHIKNIKLEQAGSYYCYAFNDAGHHIAETKVVVNPPPRVHVPRTIVNSDIDIEAVLECTAHESARHHIRWYKNDALIEDSSSNFKVSTLGSQSNLTVFPTSDADFGTFTCEAENRFGKHNKSIELVQSPVVDDLVVNGTTLFWVVNSHQPLVSMEVELKPVADENEWRKLTVPLPEANGHKYEVSYLLEDKQLEAGEYTAYVHVQNTKNWGRSSVPALVKIDVEDAQPQYIQHASVIRGGNSAHSIRPAYTVLSTILMYLLVRMF